MTQGVTRALQRINQIQSGLDSLGAGRPVAGAGRPAFSSALSVAIPGISSAGVSSPASTGGQRAVELAREFMGVPYVWGGEGPKGFDCSGLVKYVFGKLGVELPHYTVTQAQRGAPVARQDLQPGDCIFFGENKGKGFLHHVGIYVGNNSFIHAPRTGDVVKISRLEGHYEDEFACARRYL